MRALLLFLGLLWGLTGCSPASEQPTPPNPPEPPVAAPREPGTTTTAPADTLDAVWTENPIEVERATDEATLHAVRSAAHEGFDRVVFEFAEAALPSYRVAFTDDPVRQCGSGNPVALAGDARLEIRFDRTRAHTDAGTPTVADRERAPNLSQLRALTLTCDFEGSVEWALGLAAPGPFRVTELFDPARLVVDLKR